MEGGGERAIARHTQRNRKLLVRDRLRLLLDDEDFLELSLFAGLGLPYGDIPSAGSMTGQKRLQISVTAAKYPHLISLFQIVFCLLHIFWDPSVTLYAFFFYSSVQTSFRHRQDQRSVVCVCCQRRYGERRHIVSYHGKEESPSAGNSNQKSFALRVPGRLGWSVPAAAG